MVAFSSSAIGDQLDGARVRSAGLVVFDFQTQPMRVWSGNGDLRAVIRGDTYTFRGIGELGRLSTAGFGLAGLVEEMTFTLAATETLLSAADEDAANLETIGRDVELWVQFFDDRLGRDWNILGNPLLFFWGKMGPIVITQDPPGSDGAIVRTIEVTAQNALRAHGRPPYSFFSDQDQRARSSDGADSLCARIPEFVSGSVTWPRF